MTTPAAGPAGPANPLHDPLTELANRELFVDRLEMALLRSFRFPDRRFAVLSLSVAQLATIDAAHGYEVADEVLRGFAERLKAVVRNYDSLAHVTRDQFAILLESVRDVSDPARVATRLHDALREPVPTRAGEFMLSAHVGIVLNHSGADSAGRLMQLSGLARLRSASSSSAWELYDPAMQDQVRSRLQREMELRRALERSQFTLHYQPIIAMDTGRIVQAEALIRWKHPTRGVVNAGEFIALAEDTGLTVPMGWFSLQEASRQLSAWRSTLPTNGTFAVSVNLTAAHFKQAGMAEQLGSMLKGARLAAPGGINLEVTERLLIDDPRKAIDTLNQLRQLGVGIHLDDFGTGYSSLQYLHELPFDAIKIDRSFIARLSNGGRDAQIVATIRGLARQLGVPVVAEGVETEEHLTLVRALGCEFAQGYFFARPMPAEELGQLITRSPRW